MVNRVTYYLHYDLDDNHNVIIKNELFDEWLVDIMNKSCELNIILIDRFGIANSKTDDIVNEFVKDCKSKDRNRYCPYPYNDGFNQFPELLIRFISNLIREMTFKGVHDFDVIQRYSGESFGISVPDDLVLEEKREELLAYGPDDLFAILSIGNVFNCVVAAFYLWLYRTDRLYDKSDETNLLKFKIGLH